VFFGTPHHGGNFAKVGDVVSKITRGVLRNPGSDLMQALMKDSQFARENREAYLEISDSIQVFTIYETLPMPKVGVVCYTSYLRGTSTANELTHIGRSFPGNPL
jgi:hypothetical protein